MFNTKINLSPTLTITIKPLPTSQPKVAIYINDKFYMSNIPEESAKYIINDLRLAYADEIDEVGE